MDLQALIDVNKLWHKIYPYTSEHALSLYGRKSGKVLEMGVFSGGITHYLAKTYPEIDNTILTDDPAFSLAVSDWLASEGLSIPVMTSPLYATGLADASFDLVILRGAFFFIVDEPKILNEIYRLIKDDGMAFVGGVGGKGVPDETIGEIKVESQIQNDNLGRRRVTIDQLRGIIKEVGLEDKIKIHEEGGVWLEIRKGI